MSETQKKIKELEQRIRDLEARPVLDFPSPCRLIAPYHSAIPCPSIPPYYIGHPLFQPGT